MPEFDFNELLEQVFDDPNSDASKLLDKLNEIAPPMTFRAPTIHVYDEDTEPDYNSQISRDNPGEYHITSNFSSNDYWMIRELSLTHTTEGEDFTPKSALVTIKYDHIDHLSRPILNYEFMLPDSGLLVHAETQALGSIFAAFYDSKGRLEGVNIPSTSFWKRHQDYLKALRSFPEEINPVTGEKDYTMDFYEHFYSDVDEARPHISLDIDPETSRFRVFAPEMLDPTFFNPHINKPANLRPRILTELSSAEDPRTDARMVIIGDEIGIYISIRDKTAEQKTASMLSIPRNIKDFSLMTRAATDPGRAWIHIPRISGAPFDLQVPAFDIDILTFDKRFLAPLEPFA